MDVVVVCDNTGQVERLDELLDLPMGAVSYPVARLSEGVIFPEVGVSILTDHQIFNRYRRRHRKKFKGGAPLSSFEDLTAGDLVVHEDHGIGKYEGIIRMELDEFRYLLQHIKPLSRWEICATIYRPSVGQRDAIQRPSTSSC